MKYYVMITGVFFGLIVVAHFARIYAEGISPASEPIFILSTAASVALCIWALFLLKKPSRRD
ncbi:MAG: hypothetical protein ABJA66_17865 [Actinomycetota bacterium]